MTRPPSVKVLIVDDQPENILALSTILQELELECVTAANGEQALRLLIKEDFAIILLDVMMPGLNGFETAQLIRQRPRSQSTPIIFLTAAYTSPSDAAQGYALGAVDYIFKPVDTEILKSKVSVFAELYRKSEEVKQAAERIRFIEKREHENRLLAVRRQMETAIYHLQEEHRITRAILENAPMGIATTDNEFNAVEVNEVFARQFGIDVQELVSHSIFDALPLPKDSILESLSQGRPFSNEFSIADLDSPPGQARHFSLAAWPIHGENNQLQGSVFMALDVTEKVRLNQQREEFVATLAHDLQTPAVASQRAAELLRKSLGDQLGPTQMKFLELLEQNTQEMLGLIHELLEMYRYETGAQRLFLDSLDLGLNVSTCVDSLEAVATKHRVSLVTEIEENLPLVMGDRTAIRRVILNLLDNAIKYCTEGASVDVGLKLDGGDLCLSVSNSGPKIPNDQMPFIFDRFWNRPASVQKTGIRASFGLGLYVCRQIVTAHHGQIACTSSDTMTTFTVRLPFRTEESSSQEERTSLTPG